MDIITINSEIIAFAGDVSVLCGTIGQVAERYGIDKELFLFAVRNGRDIRSVYFDLPIEGVNYVTYEEAEEDVREWLDFHLCGNEI